MSVGFISPQRITFFCVRIILKYLCFKWFLALISQKHFTMELIHIPVEGKTVETDKHVKGELNACGCHYLYSNARWICKGIIRMQHLKYFRTRNFLWFFSIVLIYLWVCQHWHSRQRQSEYDMIWCVCVEFIWFNKRPFLFLFARDADCYCDCRNHVGCNVIVFFVFFDCLIVPL